MLIMLIISAGLSTPLLDLTDKIKQVYDKSRRFSQNQRMVQKMELVILGYKFKCDSMDEAIRFVCKYFESKFSRIFLLDNGHEKHIKICFE